ncbi:unnamed protein product, partial [Staurois parvus]
WHCRVGWPFINGLPAPLLVRAVSLDTVKHRSSDGTSVRVNKMSLVTSLLTTCEICE